MIPLQYYSYPTNLTGIGDILIYNNSSSGGLFGLMILIAIFIISLLTMKRFKDEIVLVASSAITAISAVLFWIMGLISTEILTVFTVIFFGSILLMKAREDNT